MAEKRAIVITATGEHKDLGHKPTYEEARKIVDGLVEVARGTDPEGRKFQMLVNEEGIPRNLPYNLKASQIYRVSPIFGDVIVLYGWRFT